MGHVRLYRGKLGGDRQTADGRACRLLFAFLTRAQRRSYLRCASFRMTAPSGTEYLIYPHHIIRAPGTGWERSQCWSVGDFGRGCLYALPLADRVLALVVLLKTDEKNLWRRLTRYSEYEPMWMRRAGY